MVFFDNTFCLPIISSSSIFNVNVFVIQQWKPAIT